ncbi:transporter substrate-binding domain-containing protein [Neopusillimonas aromaticivorans]|uniref:transporter substrate-binding domain-containing protein n=1 Tax=Neopusillimonas aromaticivorans TaxID=2979868 RepID=UPI0025987940|nr:transporter substrate-binding domain-containing protein [Neopusillimonas aromaticivorans]WJJ94961.1 transporter substrate-binding domain-containing protein [Neopusillimonas aromaticivorans]
MCAHQNWHPLESVGPRGEHRGIGAGIMQTLEKRLGIETVLYPTASWKGALDALVARKCDVLSTAAAGSGLHNQSELEYTTPYYAVPTVVLSRIESPSSRPWPNWPTSLLVSPLTLANTTICGYATPT